MKADREMAISAMQSMGWTAKRLTNRKHPHWEFSRPDTSGLWDKVIASQHSLSMQWVADISIKYGDAEDLFTEIAGAKDRWLKRRFFGIYQSHGGSDD